MSDRVASTRADVDVLTGRLAGVYEPQRSDRVAGYGKLAFFLALPVALFSVLERDPANMADLAFLVAGSLFSVGIGISLFLEHTATYTIDATSFARRNVVPIGHWSVHVSDVFAIDLGSDGNDMWFEITSATDRKRKFVLRKAAQKKLEPLYPEYFGSGEIDYSRLEEYDRRRAAEFHGSAFKTCVLIVAAGAAAMALDLSFEDESLHVVFAVALSLAGTLGVIAVMFGLAGAVYFALQRKAAREGRATAELSSRYRPIAYTMLAVVVIGVAVLMFILARKGLVTWS